LERQLFKISFLGEGKSFLTYRTVENVTPDTGGRTVDQTPVWTHAFGMVVRSAVTEVARNLVIQHRPRNRLRGPPRDRIDVLGILPLDRATVRPGELVRRVDDPTDAMPVPVRSPHGDLCNRELTRPGFPSGFVEHVYR
jgi:hypothetical protein